MLYPISFLVLFVKQHKDKRIYKIQKNHYGQFKNKIYELVGYDVKSHGLFYFNFSFETV